VEEEVEGGFWFWSAEAEDGDLRWAGGELAKRFWEEVLSVLLLDLLVLLLSCVDEEIVVPPMPRLSLVKVPMNLANASSSSSSSPSRLRSKLLLSLLLWSPDLSPEAALSSLSSSSRIWFVTLFRWLPGGLVPAFEASPLEAAARDAGFLAVVDEDPSFESLGEPAWMDHRGVEGEGVGVAVGKGVSTESDSRLAWTALARQRWNVSAHRSGRLQRPQDAHSPCCLYYSSPASPRQSQTPRRRVRAPCPSCWRYSRGGRRRYSWSVYRVHRRGRPLRLPCNPA